ncbi:endospore germination permease [Paenibacillus sp. MMS20-IR301]|uniref:GerAB/ArcD/ProY family transporter n=1 Tax=Paenibacillus sp. MMS20-IR301 TaxID=2895946 RepID=UPI0028EE8F03|nr:endospore germination permease [Paenibacillus sp. MMS20-IR301]WNS44902.1 endospore germination permease [Paenibacillus sp. MMS20-IR301]
MSIEKDRISTAQLVILGLFTLIGDMALVYPAAMTTAAHQDAWIAALISIPLGLGTVFLMVTVANINPNKTIIELSQQIMGKWIGRVIGVFYLFFFIIAASTYVREIEDFMCTQIYEGTPGGVIRFMSIVLLVYGLRLGLETVSRAAQVFFPLFAVFLVCLMLLLLPQVKLERIYPILNTPLPDMLHAVMFGVFYPFGELCVFFMVYPFAQKNSKTNRDIFLCLVFGSAGLNLILFLSLTVLGVYFSEHNFYAAYVLAQKINIANFLQRLEALMATAWIITTYFKTALYFYAFVLGTAQLLKLKSHRPLIFPVAFLIYGLSQLIAKNIIFYVKEIPAYWVDWDFTVSLVLPLILLVVHKVKERAAAA